MTPGQGPATFSDTPISDLAFAFETFSESSRRLEEAYGVLQERVREIDRELVETNERLARKVEELNSLTRYLNGILASMDNGLVAVDAAGRATSFNQAAERILGIRAADALGRPHAQLLGEADGSPAPLAEVLARGRSLAGREREVVSGAGKCLRLSSSLAPIRDSSGALIGAVEVFSDLTAFRELQDRLDRADKLAALGEMAAQLAHEIRNPLNGIEGFASLLVRDLEPESKLGQFARNIVAGARSLNKIVTNMLAFSQPHAFQPAPARLAALLDEALAFVAEECRHLGRADVAFSRDYDPEADAIVADADQLRQAVMNLLLNAVQALGAGGGEVRLASRARGGDRVEIRVQDTGPGIPDAVRERVCEPFFTTKSSGTGLGLAIVQKIVRAHGGRLELDSQPGRGTAAVLDLPRRPAPDPSEVSPHGH